MTPPSVPLSQGLGRKRPPPRPPLARRGPSPDCWRSDLAPAPLKVGGDGGAERSAGGEGPRRAALPVPAAAPAPALVPRPVLPEPRAWRVPAFACPSPLLHLRRCVPPLPAFVVLLFHPAPPTCFFALVVPPWEAVYLCVSIPRLTPLSGAPYPGRPGFSLLLPP